MTYSLSFELDGLPKSQTNNYGHWAIRHKSKKEWEARVFNAVRGNLPSKPLVRARLRFTRCSAAQPDFDNLVASFKPIMDGLITAGIIEDDKPSVIGSPVYLHELARPKQGKVRVVVESVEDGEDR